MAGRRIDLTSLGAKAAAAPAAPPTQAPPASPSEPTPPRRRAPKAPAAADAARPTRRRTKAKTAGEWVPYSDYERKETRLRADQYEDLGAASRQLNRTRNGEGERITENTLIRVAIDLLLSRQDDLAGKTEAEIRKSVGL